MLSEDMPPAVLMRRTTFALPLTLAFLFARSALGQEQGPSLGLGFDIRQELRSPVFEFLVQVSPSRRALGGDGRTQGRVVFDPGVAPQSSSRVDIAYASVGVGLRHDIVQHGPRRTPSFAVSSSVEAGLNYASIAGFTVFGGDTLAFGRRAVTVPVLRFELGARTRIGRENNPAAFTAGLGYVVRLNRDGETLGLRDRLFTSFGIELWLP